MYMANVMVNVNVISRFRFPVNREFLTGDELNEKQKEKNIMEFMREDHYRVYFVCNNFFELASQNCKFTTTKCAFSFRSSVLLLTLVTILRAILKLLMLKDSQ